MDGLSIIKHLVLIYLSIFFFRCPSNFIGTRCEFDNPCVINPCLNSALCTPNPDDGTFECQCLEGFSGDLCNVTTLQACASLPCQNGATCSDVGESDFFCTCSSGMSDVKD